MGVAQRHKGFLRDANIAHNGGTGHGWSRHGAVDTTTMEDMLFGVAVDVADNGVVIRG